MKRSAVRAWYLVHKWTSLVCTLFLLMLCLTGLPLIFHDEIEAGDHVIVLLQIHEVGAGESEHPLVFHKSGFAKLHRDDLDPTRLDGRINGAEVKAQVGDDTGDDAAA